MPELVHFLEDHFVSLYVLVLLYGAFRCPPKTEITITKT